MNWDGIISLLFFCIEIILLFNVLYFSGKHKEFRPGIYLIALLAGYQFFEFLMCSLKLQQNIFPFLAFSDITFLPPLGLLFALEYLGKKIPPRIYFFIPAVLFIIYFLFTLDKFAVVQCTVLYAVLNYPGGEIYGLFYYLPIVSAIIFLFSGLKKQTDPVKKNIRILIAAYAFTMLPVMAAFIFWFAGNDFLIRMIESVMCKFALVLAVCFSYVIIYTTREKNIE